MNLALVGNPNTGKSTLFHRLTGVRVGVGNLAGVTMVANVAPGKWDGAQDWTIHDLPGLHNLHAQTDDGRVTEDFLLAPESRPDAVILVLDPASLQGQLFLALQVRDLGLPCMAVLNRMDGTRAAHEARHLAEALGMPVHEVDALNDDPARWVKAWQAFLANPRTASQEVAVSPGLLKPLAQLREATKGWSDGALLHALRSDRAPSWIPADAWRASRSTLGSAAALQLEEASERLEDIKAMVPPSPAPATHWLDALLAHPVGGILAFGVVFFLMFQAVYSWANAPMEWLDAAMAAGIEQVAGTMQDSWWKSLLVDGVLAGLSGVLIFLPQIMILFGFTALLEHSGTMARLGFVGERLLTRLGLGGRSAVSLVGGMACAIPAIMAARALPNRRERLITVLVTPLMTCAARLPVYAFLIAFVVPAGTVWGMNRQGLFLYALYMVSTLAALGLAWALNRGLPPADRPLEVVETWPAFRVPSWRLVLANMVSQGVGFVRSAGQIIVLLSILLWGLGYFGPAGDVPRGQMDDATRFETSYLAAMGDAIEPVVTPLGYDGRMGIALLSSFAAREVFVGTMQTLYPATDGRVVTVGELKQRLSSEIHPTTGRPLFTTASAASLIVFYMFAMQCMSTVAIVRSELNSWPWALGHAVGLTTLAYVFAWLTHAILL